MRLFSAGLGQCSALFQEFQDPASVLHQNAFVPQFLPPGRAGWEFAAGLPGSSGQSNLGCRLPSDLRREYTFLLIVAL